MSKGLYSSDVIPITPNLLGKVADPLVRKDVTIIMTVIKYSAYTTQGIQADI